MCFYLGHVNRYILLMYAHIEIFMFHLPIIYHIVQINFTLHFYHFKQMLKEQLIDASYIVLFHNDKS